MIYKTKIGLLYPCKIIFTLPLYVTEKACTCFISYPTPVLFVSLRSTVWLSVKIENRKVLLCSPCSNGNPLPKVSPSDRSLKTSPISLSTTCNGHPCNTCETFATKLWHISNCGYPPISSHHANFSLWFSFMNLIPGTLTSFVYFYHRPLGIIGCIIAYHNAYVLPNPQNLCTD